VELREYLFHKRLTLTAFCKHINYDVAYISKIIHGNRKPGRKLAEIIEKATDGEVTAEELLKDKEK
jgi:DNA-binding transcriptional regulator YdaS (Cro superfamily)